MTDKNVRAFSPLTKTHPAVTAGTRCRLCDEPFLVGERPCLLPMATTDDENIVEAALAHWTCHLATEKVAKAYVDHVTDSARRQQKEEPTWVPTLNGEGSRADLARQTDDERIGDKEDEAERNPR